MPMLYPPKPVRSLDQQVEPQSSQLDAAARKAERRRRERLFEIEFFAHDDDASPPGSRAALETLEYPAHVSSAAILSDPAGRTEGPSEARVSDRAQAQPSTIRVRLDGEMDPRLARAIVAAANGWVIERYR